SRSTKMATGPSQLSGKMANSNMGAFRGGGRLSEGGERDCFHDGRQRESSHGKMNGPATFLFPAIDESLSLFPSLTQTTCASFMRADINHNRSSNPPVTAGVQTLLWLERPPMGHR